MKYDIENQRTKTIIAFEGDLDIDATELMEEKIAPALMKCNDIVIDFSSVDFVDSSGIGLLITLVKSLQEHGKEIEIIKLNREVKQVFELLQLPEILGFDVLADFRGN